MPVDLGQKGFSWLILSAMYRKETPEERLDNLWMDLQALEMERYDLLRYLASPRFIRGLESQAALEDRFDSAKGRVRRLTGQRLQALSAFILEWNDASYDVKVAVAHRVGVDPEKMPAHVDALRNSFKEPDWDVALALLTSWLAGQVAGDDPGVREHWDAEMEGPVHPEPVTRDGGFVVALLLLLVLVAIFLKSHRAS